METLVAGVAADSGPPEPFDDGDVLSAELSLLYGSVFLRLAPCRMSSGLDSATMEPERWFVL